MREIIGHSKAKRKLHKHSVIPQELYAVPGVPNDIVQYLGCAEWDWVEKNVLVWLMWRRLCIFSHIQNGFIKVQTALVKDTVFVLTTGWYSSSY